jgi:hypothetical protein
LPIGTASCGPNSSKAQRRYRGQNGRCSSVMISPAWRTVDKEPVKNSPARMVRAPAAPTRVISASQVTADLTRRVPAVVRWAAIAGFAQWRPPARRSRRPPGGPSPRRRRTGGLGAARGLAAITWQGVLRRTALPDGDPGPRDAGHGRRPPPLRRRRSSHDWKAIVLEPSLIGRVLTRRILRRTIGLAP